MEVQPAGVAESMLRWYLVSGGSYGALILILGLLLSVWALVNLVTTRNRALVLIQVFLSFLPLLIGLTAVSGATQEYMVMARSEQAPKPSEFDRVISLGLVCGILGPLGTLVPAILGLVKLSVLSGPVQRDDSQQP